MNATIAATISPYEMLDHVPVGICVLRSDNRVLFWNRLMEDWTGVQKPEIEGHDIGEHFPALREPKYAVRLRTVFDGGPPAVFSSQLHGHIFPAKLRGGEFRIQHTTVKSVEESDTGALHAFITVQDVTELTQRIQGYRAMRDQALEEIQERRRAENALRGAMQELESFSYSISHDLRAPLRAISGFAQIIRRRYFSQLDEDAQHYFTNIIDASAHMERLIDDLLIYSRMGRKQLDTSQTTLDVLVRRLGVDMEARVQEQGGELELPRVIPKVEVVEVLLTQILGNLLTNALTYHRPNVAPCVRLECHLDGPTLVLEVTDNGIGIPAEYQDKIFNVFQRLHSQEEYPGTGIGLANVRKAVGLMGGNISLHSELGAGSTFRVVLPLPVRSEAPVPEPQIDAQAG